ncbi:MAG: TIGR03936 family radical SAM-associated protein [Clostridiales bacterium]|nr:TIGR03936 family radical SAM-associated protein [Clostridiales bacterium]
MRNKYVIKLAKGGYLKYISHLDMVRLFKSAFKRAGIRLTHSQGFNPHPRLSLAQPLPLGYSSTCELLEFEISEDMKPAEILDKMRQAVPEGIKLLGCGRAAEGKSLAARAVAASYEVRIPLDAGFECDFGELCENFMKQEAIPALKRQKKADVKKETDIKGMIRELQGEKVDDNLILYIKVDAGNRSNLSPELLIPAFASFAGINTAREEMDVTRTGLYFLR